MNLDLISFLKGLLLFILFVYNFVFLFNTLAEDADLYDIYVMIKECSIGELLLFIFLIPALICHLLVRFLKYKPFSKE